MKTLKSVVVLLAVVAMTLPGSPIPAVGGSANAGNCPEGWFEVTLGSDNVCFYEAPNGGMYKSYDECMRTCNANDKIGSSIFFGAAMVSVMFGPWGLVPGAIFATVGYVSDMLSGSCEDACKVPG